MFFFIKKPVLERLHLYTEANHGGRLKIKMSYRYMDYHHENNHDTLIFIMKIPIPWKTVFLLRWTPILSFITIYLHWDGVDNWNPPSRKIWTRNLNQSYTTFIEWNLCYNIVSKMAVILFRPKYVNSYLVWLLFSFCEQCHHPLEVPCWGQYSVDIWCIPYLRHSCPTHSTHYWHSQPNTPVCSELFHWQTKSPHNEGLLDKSSRHLLIPLRSPRNVPQNL